MQKGRYLVKNRYLQEKYLSMSHFIKASNWFNTWEIPRLF